MQAPALTTTLNRASPWSLLVSSSLENTASGSIYLDDGESLVPNATLWVTLTLSQNTLSATARGSFVDNSRLSNVTVLGVQQPVSAVSFKGAPVAASEWVYDGTSKVLAVTGLFNACETAWGTDWELKWT